MRNIKAYLIAILVLPLSLSLRSQDNHDYATPTGKSVYFRNVNDANRIALYMNEIQPVSEGATGLMVMFNLRADLSKISSPLKLLSFSLSSERDSHIDIFYTNKTLMFRRKLEGGSPYYYDYDLYDPMFSVEDGEVVWEVKIFFTGYFFWIETRNTNKLLSNKWHAPIFFGLNLPNQDIMSKFLQRSENAVIILGDADTNALFTMPEEVMMCEFDYASLKDELQKNFCNDY